METKLRLEHFFEVPHLQIPYALVGARIVTTHEGVPLELALPTFDYLGKPTGNPRIQLAGSHANGDISQNVYDVARVIINTFPTITLDLPEDAPDKDTVALELMYQMAKGSAQVAQHAFDRWIRLVRWKTLRPWIGRSDHVRSWKGKLYNRESVKELLSTGYNEIIGRSGHLGVEAWDTVSQAMQSGTQSPVWFDLFLDAEWHLDEGDLRRFVVDAAVACEIYIKARVIEHLPPLRPKMQEHIEKANASTYYEKLFPEIIPSDQELVWHEIKGPLHELFRARNGFLHQGTNPSVTAIACKGYAKAARSLLTLF